MRLRAGHFQGPHIRVRCMTPVVHRRGAPAATRDVPHGDYQDNRNVNAQFLQGRCRVEGPQPEALGGACPNCPIVIVSAAVALLCIGGFVLVASSKTWTVKL